MATATPAVSATAQRAVRRSWIIAALPFLALALAPLYLGPYHLTLAGRFLSLGILAMGIVLVWGQGGVLPLGQGVFFGLGGYALAMHLKLVALPAGEIPDFMQWNGLDQLPRWWQPFTSPVVALVTVVAVPAVASLVLAWLVFRRRMTSVYIALITQALALAFATLLISQQGTTGGFNGLTNFDTLFGVPLGDDQTRVWLHLITVAVAALAYLFARVLGATQAGRLVTAVRDGENRVRFLGYSPAPYKILVFALAGMFAGVAGALHTLHLGLISPAMVGVVPSIEMVIWVAVGGRTSLYGALIGTAVVNVAKDSISSEWPSAWLYLMGLVFILIVVATPRGLAGIAGSFAATLRQRRQHREPGSVALPTATARPAPLASDAKPAEPLGDPEVAHHG
jgi:urea transport system permease protein